MKHVRSSTLSRRWFVNAFISFFLTLLEPYRIGNVPFLRRGAGGHVRAQVLLDKALDALADCVQLGLRMHMHMHMHVRVHNNSRRGRRQTVEQLQM